MRLEQIEYFLSVASHKSITKAARALYISQPALSKQMTLLEQELGVALLERLPRGIALTAAGEQFEADLKRIRKELDRAKENAVRVGKKQKQVLRIGCFDGAYTDDFLPPLYQYFKSTNPDLKLILSQSPFRENMENLKNGMQDLVLTLSPDWKEIEGYRQKKLLHRQGALIYSRMAPIYGKENLTLADFAEMTYLVEHRDNSTGMSEHEKKNLQRLGMDTNRMEEEEVDNFATLLSYLKLGYGYKILTADVVKRDPALEKFDLPEEYGVDIVAIWREDHEELTEWMSAFHL